MVLDVWYKYGILKRTFTSIWWLWIRMYNIRCYFSESYWWRVDCIL